MERQSSFGSQSSAGSAFTSKSATTKLVNEAEKENAMEGQAPGLLTALFGALYTLAKEKINDSANVAMLAIWVDFLMIFTLILMPEYPWEVDSSLWIFKVFYYIQVHLPIANTGYQFYLVIFYILVATLFISVAICVWVGWCFKNDNFPYLWPIKVARVVVSLFVSMFYIASLNIFLMACACDKEKGHWTHLIFKLDCLSFPHLIHAIMSLTSGAVFFVVAVFLVLGDHELEPMSKSLLATPHSMCELRSLLCKTVITVSDILLKPLPRVQTVLYTIACGLIFYYHARMVPHYVPWINVLRGGLNAVLAWVSLMCCILTYTVHWEYDDHGHPHWDMHDYRHTMTTLMAIGVPVSFLAGAGICWGHLVYAWRTALKFRVLPEGVKPRTIHRFLTEFDVEVASRIGRVWDVEGVLDQTALELAENVLKAGVAMKPNSVFMHIAYSNFLIDVRHNIQSGWNHLEQATKLGPNLSYQFSIFTRKQEHKQQSGGGGGGGEGGAVDLVSYVEFQKNYKSLMIYHKASLVATRDFWRLLTRDKVPLERLGHSFKRMDEMESKAEATYKMVLDRYPSNAKLLRSYGKFLESIKNDPWGAARYYAEAEKQEELEESRAADIQAGDDTVVNDKSSGMISINASGIIQMANKVATQMLGYKKGELNGKNVSAIMPAPFSTRHNSFLRNYINTNTPKILDTSREVVALHKERYVFPVTLKVTKISGTGVDATFMGIMKPTEVDSNIIKAWLLPTGTTLCADLSFVDYVGWGPEELVGRAFSSLGADSSELDDLIAQAASFTEAQLAAGALQLTTNIKHKYADDVPVQIKVELGGTETQRILVMCMHRLADTPPMAAFDHKGRCIYANTPLANMLGYKVKVLRSKDISQLLPQPFGVLHLKWLKDADAMHSRASANSCRSGMTSVMLTSNATPVYVTPTIIPHGPSETTSGLAALADHGGGSSGSTWAIKLQRSSRAQLLNERRLCLGLSAAGGIVWASGGTPDGLFGMAPRSLLGQPITALVDIFADYTSDADLSAPLAALINCVAMKPGASWRVGVGFLTAEHQAKAQEAAAAAAAAAAAEKRILLRQSTAKSKARPAIMTVILPGDESLPEEAAAASADTALFVELWRADMLFAVAEVVESCSIVRAEPSMGLVFGSSHARMLQTSLSKWLGLPAGVQLADLMGTKGHKKGGLKSSHMHKSGPCKQLNGMHADRRPLAVSLQACLKDGTQDSRLVLGIKVRNPLTGAPGALAALVAAEDGNAQPAAEEGVRAVPGLALDRVGADSGAGDLLSPNRATQRSNAPASNLVTARLIDVDMTGPEGAGAVKGRAPATLAASPAGSADGHHHRRHHEGEHVGFAGPDGSHNGSQQGHQMDVSSGGSEEEAHAAAALAASKKKKKKHLTEDEMEAALAAKGASKAREWLDSNFGVYKKAGAGLPGAVTDASEPMQLVKGRHNGGSSSSGGGGGAAEAKPEGGGDDDAAAAAPGGAGTEGGSEATASTAADGGIVSDYGRGKRLRKLVRLLSSKAALQTVVGFRFKVILLAGAIMLVHMGAFGALLGFIGRQDAYMDEVAASGAVLDTMHRVAALSLVLEAAQRGYGFDATVIPTYAAEMADNYDRFDALHQGLYLGFSGLRVLDTSRLYTLWHEDGLNATTYLNATDPTHGTTLTTSLFNLGGMFSAAAKEVQYSVLNPTTAKQPGPLANNRDWQFLQANGPGSLYEPYTESLDLMVARAEDNVAMVQRVLLALLCIEGAAFMVLAIGTFIRLLASISVHRQALFSVFLAIPNSYLRTLASKSVSIGDENADEEDEDDKVMQAAADARKKQQKSDQADTQAAQDDDSMWGSVPGAVARAAQDAKKKPLRASFAALDEAPGDAQVVVSTRPGAGRTKGPGPAAAAGGLGAASLSGGSAPGGAVADRQRLFHGKVLVTSARSSYQLSWPILLWGVLVLALYGVSYNALGNMRDSLVSLKMTQKALVTSSRLTYHALRAALDPDVAKRAALQPALDEESQHLLWVYHAALYGVNMSTPTQSLSAAEGDLDPGAGSLFASAGHKYLLFDVNGCVRYDPSTCLDVSSPFWPITNAGVDALVMRLVEEAQLMAVYDPAVIGTDSPGFNFVWQAGWYDLHDGLAQLVDKYIVEAKATFDEQRALHTVLVVVMVVGGIAFLVMMLRPFLRHISKESRRCAELLVQLPPELDVEGMVAATWGVVKQERLMVERSGRTFIDSMGMKSLRVGLSMLSRSFLGTAQQQQQLAHGQGRLSALGAEEDRLFTPRYAADGPAGATPRNRPPPGGGSGRAAGRAHEGFFEEVGPGGREGEDGGPAFPHPRASLDAPPLRHRRGPGGPGASGPGARASPRGAVSRRAIVPVDDDML